MTIAIVGLGQTGTEIAHAVALSGEPIILIDTQESVLPAALACISRELDQTVQQKKITSLQARRARRVFTLSTDLQACSRAELVIEALPDTLAVKQPVLQALDRIVPLDTILAISTDTLSVTKLAATTQVPGRVIGLHFCSPAYLRQAVEVIHGPNTQQNSIDYAIALVHKLEKTPVVVPDMPGWIVNRLTQAYWGEALHLLDAGNLSEQIIDQLMTAAGFPAGPFRLMDEMGVDRVFAMAQALFEATYHTAPYRPHPRLQRLVEAGRLGRTSTRGGFYPNSTQKK